MSTPSYDQMDAMSYEDLERLARGQDAPAPAEAPTQEQPAREAETAVEEAPETPREERQEAEAQEEARPLQPDPTPNPHAENHLKALQEERARAQQERDRAKQLEEQAQREAIQRQALEQQHKALLDALNDPERVRQHLASIAPGPAPDFEEDPQGAIAHHLAPLQQKLAAVEQELARTKQEQAQRAYLDQLAAKHGGDFHTTLATFDKSNPHLSSLDPELRYLTALGIQAKQTQATDPATEEARINALAEAKAKQMAEQQLATVLASGKPAKGIPTLGAAPQARQEQAAPDFSAMSYDDIHKMAPDQLREQARRAYGGG